MKVQTDVVALVSVRCANNQWMTDEIAQLVTPKLAEAVASKALVGVRNVCPLRETICAKWPPCHRGTLTEVLQAT